MDLLKTVFVCFFIAALSALLTWFVKDVVDPCPSVSCEPAVKIRAEVNGKRGDLVVEDARWYFYPEAEEGK